MRPFAIRVLATGAMGLLASACLFGGNGKDDNSGGGDGTDAGAKADGGSASSFDSGGGGGGGDTDAGGGSKDAGAPTCPVPVAITNIPQWKSSVQKLAACSSSEIGLLSSYLTEPPSGWAAAAGMLSTTCQKCVFSNVGDANWGVVVWSPNQAAGTGFINVGGCYQVLSGSNACGAAAQQFNACTDLSCPSTCQNQSSCRSVVQTGACGSSLSSAQSASACGSNYSNFSSSCSESNPGTLVNTVCGAGGAG